MYFQSYYLSKSTANIMYNKNSKNVDSVIVFTFKLTKCTENLKEKVVLLYVSTI